MDLPQQLVTSEDITNPLILQSLFEKEAPETIQRIETGGYSGAIFFEVRLNAQERLILKIVDLNDDWFSYRTQDTIGREGQVLTEPTLSEVHRIFYSPYKTIIRQGHRLGFLMEDLTTGLFPNKKKPLPKVDQNLMIERLAALHAHYWEDQRLSKLSWLMNIDNTIYQMGPLDHVPYEGGSARNVQDQIKAGWEAAEALLSKPLKKALWQKSEEITRHWKHLPKTLIHGDTKVANFAKASDGRLCLFDWAFAGFAPCTFELGWFISVNASRLADSKEQVIAGYREALEKHLGRKIEDQLWHKMEEAGMVCGVLMLLWSKALGVVNGREGGQQEWDWWIDRLEAWAS